MATNSISTKDHTSDELSLISEDDSTPLTSSYGSLQKANKKNRTSIEHDTVSNQDSDCYELLEGEEYTTSQIISHLGMGNAQIMIVTVLFFAWFSENSAIFLMPILSTRLYVEWNLTTEGEALLSAASYAGFAFSYPIWGFVADRLGRKPALIWSHLWILVCSVLCSLAPNLSWLIIFRILFSLAGGVMNLIIPLYYEFLPPQSRWIGFVSGNGLAAAFGSMLPILAAIAILDKTPGSWRYFVLVCSAPFLFFILIAMLWLVESPRYLVSVGRTTEAEKVLRRIARMNNRELPKKLTLIPEIEIGATTEKEATYLDAVKILLSESKIIISFICILLLGLASRYVIYGMAFVKTELIFMDAESKSNYCHSASHKKSYELETKDYLMMLAIQSTDFLAAFVMFIVLIYEWSLKFSALLCYGISIILICGLYLCPNLYVALALVGASKMLIQGPNILMWIRLSGLFPTKIRTSLFGICTFLMYLVLPITPYLVQTLSKHSQHYVTSVSVGFLLLGFISGLILPWRIYAN